MDVWLSIEVDTGNGPKEIDVWYDCITDNLAKMAKLANLYQTIWEPKWSKAKSQISPLEKGIEQLKNKDGLDMYKALESRHLWGTYDTLLRFSEKYLRACKEHPKCKVNVGEINERD